MGLQSLKLQGQKLQSHKLQSQKLPDRKLQSQKLQNRNLRNYQKLNSLLQSVIGPVVNAAPMIIALALHISLRARITYALVPKDFAPAKQTKTVHPLSSAANFKKMR